MSADEEAEVLCRHIRESVRPILEYGFVDRLRLSEVSAPVARDARPQDVVVAAFDHIDRVNLHIAQMFHRCWYCLRSGPERCEFIETLGAKPDASALRLCQGERRAARIGDKPCPGRRPRRSDRLAHTTRYTPVPEPQAPSPTTASAHSPRTRRSVACLRTGEQRSPEWEREGHPLLSPASLRLARERLLDLIYPDPRIRPEVAQSGRQVFEIEVPRPYGRRKLVPCEWRGYRGAIPGSG